MAAEDALPALPALTPRQQPDSPRRRRLRSRALPTTSVSQQAEAVTGYRWPEMIPPPLLQQEKKDHDAILCEVRELLSKRMALSSLFFSACDTNENGQIDREEVHAHMRVV